jgi:hypothetical protein
VRPQGPDGVQSIGPTHLATLRRKQMFTKLKNMTEEEVVVAMVAATILHRSLNEVDAVEIALRICKEAKKQIAD